MVIELIETTNIDSFLRLVKEKARIYYKRFNLLINVPLFIDMRDERSFRKPLVIISGTYMVNETDFGFYFLIRDLRKSSPLPELAN